MQIAQIHESETGVRWQHAEDVKACQNCQKALRSSRDKVGKIIIRNSNRTVWSLFQSVITCGAKLLNADWLRKRAFFLNHEGTFGNQEGMIT